MSFDSTEFASRKAAGQNMEPGAAVQPNPQTLDPSEFCGLLLSRRRIVRCDALDGSVLGLLDTITKELFQVKADLFQQFIMRSAEA